MIVLALWQYKMWRPCHIGDRKKRTTETWDQGLEEKVKDIASTLKHQAPTQQNP